MKVQNEFTIRVKQKYRSTHDEAWKCLELSGKYHIHMEKKLNMWTKATYNYNST